MIFECLKKNMEVICIEISKKDKAYDISFALNPALEFLYAIYTIAEEDYFLKKCNELNASPQVSLLDIIKDMKNRLSKYLITELDYFFEPYDLADGGIGFISYWTAFIKNSSIRTVPEMLECIENTNENLFLSYVVSLVVAKNSNKPIKELCIWDEVKYDNNKLLSLVADTNIENIQLKEKLVECLKNPTETKERYLLILRQLYEKAYKPIEAEILNNITGFIERYQELLNKNPEKFTTQFLNTTLSSLTVKELIHVSYFKYIGCSSWSTLPDKEVWYVLGAYAHIFTFDTISKDKILLFYKTLSDQKRLDIISLLSMRPWYVYELADELKMSAATISYHLTLLHRLEVVNYERCEHRIYYSLDKNRLKELSENAMRSLLNY
jgi:DNA-binding transcriptional ArsR family regulator